MNKHNDAVWQKVLSKDEVIKEEFSISNKYINIWGTFWTVLLGLFTIPFFFVGALFPAFYYFFYVKKANLYAFTNKRVLIHRGWLSTNLVSIDYTKITNVFISQSIFQKLLTRTGSIAIDTAGTGGQEIYLKSINEPYKIKQLLDSLKD